MLRSIESYFKFLLKVRVVSPLRSIFLRVFAAEPNKDGWENRMLIINLENIGDLVMFTSVLKHYKKRLPGKKLYLLVKSGMGMEHILKDNFADEVLTMNYRKFAANPFYGALFMNALRRIGFAKVVSHDFSAAEILGKIIATELGAEEVIGYEGMGLEFRIPFDIQQKKNLRVAANKLFPKFTTLIPRIDTSPLSLFKASSLINHYIAIYEAVMGIKETDYSTTLGAVADTGAPKKFGLEKKNYVVLTLGASMPYKRWPLESFLRVVEFLDNEGLRVILTASRAEKRLAQKFMSMSRAPIIDLAGKTTLPEFIELVRSARLVLTNDTSSTHIAVAEKVPSLTIMSGGRFGTVSNYGYDDINRWVYKEAPCFGDNLRCGLKAGRRPSPCVFAVSAEMVLDELGALTAYLKKEKNPPRSKFNRGFAPPPPPKDYKLKIIYAGIESENYNPERRPSFEYENFYMSLKNLPGTYVIEYPYEMAATLGKKKFNNDLLQLVRREKPDLFFAFMFTDELGYSTLDEIKKLTTSVAWFADDHWRLWNYSRHYAPHFSWIVTTWSKAPAIYERLGVKNVIRSQWACSAYSWRPVAIDKDINVSFVGQYNPSRAEIIGKLRKMGIDIWVRGFGWPDGRLEHKEVIKSFSRSRINLNFNTPPPRWSLKMIGRLFAKRSADRIIPDFWNIKDNFISLLNMKTPQIKARPFEILACRAFLISAFADDMDGYYKDKKEIIYYNGKLEDLVQKIRYYLEHRDECESIAKNAYERTVKEHTYERRFYEVFKKIGLKF